MSTTTSYIFHSAADTPSPWRSSAVRRGSSSCAAGAPGTLCPSRWAALNITHYTVVTVRWIKLELEHFILQASAGCGLVRLHLDSAPLCLLPASCVYGELKQCHINITFITLPTYYRPAGPRPRHQGGRGGQAGQLRPPRALPGGGGLAPSRAGTDEEKIFVDTKNISTTR